METKSVGFYGQQGQQTESKNRYEDLGMEEFLQMMIVELQHQDPMNPMSNQEMMAQIGQIREIESNTRLTETLDSLALGQAMSTASGIIGKTITGLPDGDTEFIQGVVESVSVINGNVKLLVGDKVISLSNVAVIDEPPPSTEEPGSGTDPTTEPDGPDGTEETGGTDGTDETNPDD